MEFAHLVAFCKLTQYNTIKNKYGNMLDLVLSSLSSEFVIMRGDMEPLVPEDAHHPALGVTLSVPRPAARAPAARSPPACAPTSHDSPPQWNFRKADFEQLYQTIAGLTWDEVLATSDVDGALDVFYQKIHKCLRCHVPLKGQRRPGSRYHYPTWYTPEIIKNIQEKYTYLKKSKEVGSSAQPDRAAKSTNMVTRQ
ncbi:hypothetical protein PYW07_016860 [Mythimna separata]|uniref:Uncharacterized protein n=1 Tax=Mythimna separata TaxID=271217 RepID=A0AAD7YUA2_MYTSE|nr:hypothetical protein PYW07_016860 [Mythimna separata]